VETQAGTDGGRGGLRVAREIDAAKAEAEALEQRRWRRLN